MTPEPSIPVDGCGDAAELVAEGVVESAHHLTLLDMVAQGNIDRGDSAAPGPNPGARSALGRTRDLGHHLISGIDQAEHGEDAHDSLHSGTDGVLVESPGLAALVQEHGRTGVGCGLTQ